MPFHILPIIKILSKSSSVAGTVTSLIKQYNALKNSATDSTEFRKTLELQGQLNEKLEKQVMLLQSSIELLQKRVLVLTYLVYACLAVSAAAGILAIVL